MSSSEFAFAVGFSGVDGLVTVTDTIEPFGAVTVVVTAPSGAVVSVVLSADDEAAELLVEFELVSRVSAVDALPRALRVMGFSPVEGESLAEKSLRMVCF